MRYVFVYGEHSIEKILKILEIESMFRIKFQIRFLECMYCEAFFPLDSTHFMLFASLTT